MKKIEIKTISKYNYPDSWRRRFGVHSHDFFQMFVVMAGDGVLTIDDREQYFAKNSRIMIPPNTPHSFMTVVGGEPCLLDLKFYVHDEALLNECVSIPMYEELSGELISLMELARSSWTVAGAHSQIISELLVESVLRSLLDCRADVCPEWLSLPVVEMSGLVKTVADYVETNYVQGFTLDQMAADLRYYKTYLCTAFKKETGISIMAYLSRVRIRHAVDLVCFSDLSICSIGELVGFKNACHFSSVFKRETNRTPSELRTLGMQGIHLDLLEERTFINQYHTQLGHEEELPTL